MMIARFFIERPVLANVLALLTMIIGAVVMWSLPVSQYPQMTPPTIQVTTNYPGASAQTVQQMVARTIEQQVNGVEGMLYMQSYASNDGHYTLTVSFAIGTDTDKAQINVQNRVAMALPQLPDPVQQQGVVTRKKSTGILQIITLTSTNPAHDGLYLSNYATLNLRDRLARLPGIGDVNVLGAGPYSMRIWLDAAQMRQRGLTPASVINVVRKQNQTISAGQTGMPPAPPGQQLQLTLNVDSPLNNPEEFGDLIVKTGADGSLTRLRDVARIELGTQNYGQAFSVDGKVAGGLSLFQLPDANALETAALVRAELAQFAPQLPEGMHYQIALDTTKFVKASIDEVYQTLAAAALLVLLVIIVFLQNWRATLVPATTVPVTIIGAFAVIGALGFGINLLTLFALVLSIGIVVDDAIVVVEGVSHRIEQGQTARSAAQAAMRELTGPIIGITLVLMAVFLPAAAIPGITGQMYRQFALVIAATALLSGINALTLKPAQAAQLLHQRRADAKPGRWAAAFNRSYARLERRYSAWITLLIQYRWLSATVAALTIGLSAWGFTRLPTAFIPTEDQGYLMVMVQLPDAASLERTDAVIHQVASAAQRIPGVAHAVGIAGISALDGNAAVSSAGMVYLILDDWQQRDRKHSLPVIFKAVKTMAATISSAHATVLPPPPISGLGLVGGFQMQLVLNDGSNDYHKLGAATTALLTAARADPRIQQAISPLRVEVPQLKLTLNRARTESLGVAVGDAYDALQSYLGSSYVNQFSKFGQNFTVTVQADQPFRADTDSIAKLTVKSRDGSMVPLSAFASFSTTTGPAVASLYNMMPTAAITGLVKDGYSSGEGLEALEQLALQVLPPGVGYEWTAMSLQEKLVGHSVTVVFGVALLLVYLVLAGQYESWRTPLPVLLSVPLALSGSVMALAAVGIANNIYVQIGLVLLIALSAKNAILIVEVAHQFLLDGHDVVQAALEGARRRLRPVLMTSLAFTLGVAPLLFSSGAGAAARISIGLTVLSGMLASTLLAVSLVPVFFVLIERRRTLPHAADESLAP